MLHDDWCVSSCVLSTTTCLLLMLCGFPVLGSDVAYQKVCADQGLEEHDSSSVYKLKCRIFMQFVFWSGWVRKLVYGDTGSVPSLRILMNLNTI
jgi:hypothetical protein